jgi:diguanylate cyclase (GGDEF)-like protein
MAGALETAMRRGDSAYRLGGDEFVVLLPETEMGPVEAFVSRLRATGAPSFSCGAAAYPDDGGSVEALLESADSRMLHARRLQRLQQ